MRGGRLSRGRDGSAQTRRLENRRYGQGGRHGRRPDGSAGFVLLTVLMVVMLSSMLAASVLYAMRSEATAHQASMQREQGWAAAMSGVSRALVLAAKPGVEAKEWQDNPAAFRHQVVCEDGDDRWYFSVYSASDTLGAEVRFGLSDEASKLAVGHHEAAWLARLPGLEAGLAETLKGGATAGGPAAVGTNRSVLPGGRAGPGEGGAAVRETGASVGGQAASGPGGAVTIEEWFAARGLSPKLLLGEDVNFNWRLDANEDDGEARAPLDDGNGQLDLGLQRYLTASSYDLNVDGAGQPRVNLNTAGVDLGQAGLPAVTLDYLRALRRAGQTLSHPAALLEAEGEWPDEQGRAVRMRSGVGREELALVLDRCTTTDAVRLEGLVNVNTAPAAVLAAIPFIGEALADTIVATRAGLSAEEAQTPAWLYRRGLVSAEEFKQMAPHLTTRSRQFSFRCLGYALPSGRYRVLGVAVDVARSPGRVVAVRDLTRFGFPVPLGVLEDAGVTTALVGGGSL